ncbi:MAG: hypothetical protein EXS14_08455 [Planctomycetes bacterium]|nr:hypothetical protein [Planctomycetota bacterium]
MAVHRHRQQLGHAECDHRAGHHGEDHLHLTLGSAGIEQRVGDLSVSVCAVLISEACNIGLEPLVHHDVPTLTCGRLTWVQQNYLRAERQGLWKMTRHRLRQLHLGPVHRLPRDRHSRHADLGDARFWRIDRTADYGPLEQLSRGHRRRDLAPGPAKRAHAPRLTPRHPPLHQDTWYPRG